MLSFTYFSSFLISVSVLAFLPSSVRAQSVGDTVCVEGYVMDYFCIDYVYLLDNPRYKTLEHPDKHTVHCLVDPGICNGSPFEILTDPPEGEIVYGRGWRLNESSKQTVLELARTVGDNGDCYTCYETGTLGNGFRAAMTAEVVALPDGDVPPVLDILEVQDTSTMDDPKTACRSLFAMDEFGVAPALTTEPSSPPSASFYPSTAPTEYPTVSSAPAGAEE